MGIYGRNYVGKKPGEFKPDADSINPQAPVGNYDEKRAILDTHNDSIPVVDSGDIGEKFDEAIKKGNYRK